MGIDPITAAAIGTAIFGAGAGIAGQRSANRTGAAASRNQTQLTAQQFDTRQQTARDVFGENMGLSEGAWRDLNAIDDAEFQRRTGLTKDAFAQLNEIERAQIVADAGASDENLSAIRGARTDAEGIRSQARSAYDAELAGANRGQDAYRGRADEVTRNLIAAFSQPAQQGRVADAGAQRVALQRYAGSAPPDAIPTNRMPSARLSAPLAAAFARQSQEGRDFASGQGARQAGLEAVTDALAAGNRTIDDRNADVSFIQDAATRALIPVGARMDAESLRYNNAGETRAARSRVADANLDSAVNFNAQRAAGAGRPIQAYTTSMDDALAAFYGSSRGRVGDLAGTKIDANNALLGGANSASGNFEGNMRGVNDFRTRAGQSNFWTGASQFSSALAPIFSTLGQRGSVARQPTAPNYTYGSVPGPTRPNTPAGVFG